ncbi:glycosyltransferase [Mesorhizobium sp. VK9D]|uniref:glycosyltransferase family 2 protein n=1 Tax=Mesorhizobium australafricanum TaxID=3072311 RepID=UPI002A249BC2|nr:glycosyltransferase [Mesorhizobium sp. VK9D]MDX8451976.1 glycosyltransferase [Mesorhizobium sp. VK9D]
MKVKDLVADTLWSPGSGYSDDHKPAVSILLPTFRRGASGLFRRAVESVLNQTLNDIELIIVDDASVDGTADQIAEFMRVDGRVSCLRHPRNIGLPAVSEYEAFSKARANFIGFAFDDDFFYPDALDQLLDQSLKYPHQVWYGNAVWRIREVGRPDGLVTRLGRSLSSFNLKSTNPIANCTVLLPRYVIDRVGLYDPNVLMARLCDWDLWRRISEFYLLQHIDVDVAEVTGPEQSDSLGRTYPLVSGACEEWMRVATRDLRPESFSDIDVFEIPPGLSPRTSVAIADLTESHCAKRAWMSSLKPSVPDRLGKNVFVLSADYNASTTLCFDYLPRSVRGSVRIISLDSGASVSELVEASCLIIVRYFDRYREWIDLAFDLSIPVYYFIDDNFTELSIKEKLEMPEDFSLAALRSKLSRFAGVLVTAPALEGYYLANLIHKNVFMFPVSYAKAPIALRPERSLPADKDEWRADLTIASIGGPHRQLGLQEKVIPAIQRLAAEGHRIHFVISGSGEDSRLPRILQESKNIKFTFKSTQVDWNRAILQLVEYRPDILIHAPSETVNNLYKTLNVALCAYLLDALLVVPDAEPYSVPGFDGAAAKVAPAKEPRAWLEVLTKLIANREGWGDYKKFNVSFCRKQFSGEQNVAVLNQILETLPGISSTLVETRLRKLYLSKQWVGGGAPPDAEPLRASLHELSALRSRIRRYRRFRPRLSREDLWPQVSPVFDDIRRYLQDNNIRTPDSYLELSDAIQGKDFVEYLIPIKRGTLDNISCAFSSEGIHEGTVGIELVSPDGRIERQVAIALDAGASLQLPVIFDLKGLAIPHDGMWRLRLFARSRWPIYALELARYSHLGLARRAAAPFAKVAYVDQTPDTGTAAERRGVGDVSPPLA